MISKTVLKGLNGFSVSLIVIFLLVRAAEGAVLPGGNIVVCMASGSYAQTQSSAGLTQKLSDTNLFGPGGGAGQQYFFDQYS